MKVLIANYRYFVSSGPERYLFNITRQLERRGHEVAPFSVRYARNLDTPYAKYFVSSIGADDEVYFEEHKKTPSMVAKGVARLFYSPEVEASVTRLARDFRPDVAYILYFMRKMSPSLLAGLHKQGVPIVMRISDYGVFCAEHHALRDGKPCTLCVNGNFLHAVRHRCVKGSLPISALDAAANYFHRARGYFDLVDAFVATNTFMKDMMIDAGYDARKIHVIPTFTDIERFTPPPADAPRTYFLYAGRLDPPKGVETLIRAARRLKDRLGDKAPTIKLAGAAHTGGYAEGLQALAADLDVADRVDFIGYIEPDDLPALYRGAIAYVSPALWFENLPNTLIESMACATPPVVSDIGSLRASVENGVDGLTFAPGDDEALAGRLFALLDDAALHARLSQGALRRAREVYAPGPHMERLSPLLEGLARKSRGSATATAEKSPAIQFGL
ncbi:MAG: glycosyltransferase family 4 protein [Pseudomonadota bacterium]